MIRRRRFVVRRRCDGAKRARVSETGFSRRRHHPRVVVVVVVCGGGGGGEHEQQRRHHHHRATKKKSRRRRHRLCSLTCVCIRARIDCEAKNGVQFCLRVSHITRVLKP